MSFNYFGDFRNFQRPPETGGTAAAFLIVLFVIGLASAVFALGFGWISIDVIRRPITVKAAAQPTPSSGTTFTVLDWDIADGHFYTQTNGEIPGTQATGFAVRNADGVPFWNEYQRLGGFVTVGYPISSRFQWKGFTTQVFQRAVMQWNPDANKVEMANTMDELHLAGKDEWLLKEYQVPKSVPDDFDAGRTWEEARDNRMLFIGKSQAMVDKYMSVPDPLATYGLPSSAIEEMEDHKALRLQRGVLRQWTKDMPGVRAGEVTVANSGEMILASGLLTTATTTPEPGEPPTEATPTSKPATGSQLGAIIVLPAASAQRATPTAVTQGFVRVGNTAGDGVYLRRSPRMDDRLVAWPDNTVLKIVGEPVNAEGLEWQRVEDPRGNQGWVPSQWLIQ